VRQQDQALFIHGLFQDERLQTKSLLQPRRQLDRNGQREHRAVCQIRLNGHYPPTRRKTTTLGHDRRRDKRTITKGHYKAFPRGSTSSGVGLLMGLILRSHPSTDALVQKNVLGVERFKLWVFRCSKLLANRVARAGSGLNRQHQPHSSTSR